MKTTTKKRCKTLDMSSSHEDIFHRVLQHFYHRVVSPCRLTFTAKAIKETQISADVFCPTTAKLWTSTFVNSFTAKHVLAITWTDQNVLKPSLLHKITWREDLKLSEIELNWFSWRLSLKAQNKLYLQIILAEKAINGQF